jgi:hypothetical protein
MNARTVLRLTGIAAVSLLAVGLARPEESYLGDSQSLFNFSEITPGDSVPAEEGVKPLPRGPVHEAYAGLATVNPQPGPVAPKEPPAPIKETPPKEKPAGDNVQWLPGYWAWDDDKNDFVWVSGLWRTPPPGRQWVPGHWHKGDGGWQWVSGLWTAAEQEEIKVQPPPPAPKEENPGSPPAEDSLFVPGCWLFRNNEYEWREGFWYTADPDWVLIPAHYCWTPAGYVFVDDYWDYALRNRGLLYAPVSIDPGVLAQAGWSYEPRHVVSDGCLLGALFARPSHGWYFFGDYYDKKYDLLGFLTWTIYGTKLQVPAYEPLFSWYRLRHRNEPAWERELRALHTLRRQDRAPRPPQDLKQQADLIRSLQETKALSGASALARFGIMVAPAKKVDTRAVDLKPLDNGKLAEVQKSIAKFQEVSEQRARATTKLLGDGKAPLKEKAPVQSLKLELPKGQGGKLPAGTRGPRDVPNARTGLLARKPDAVKNGNPGPNNVGNGGQQPGNKGPGGNLVRDNRPNNPGPGGNKPNNPGPGGIVRDKKPNNPGPGGNGRGPGGNPGRNLVRQDQGRVRELERERELDRQRQLDQQRQLDRQREQARLREQQRQQQLERQRQAELLEQQRLRQQQQERLRQQQFRQQQLERQRQEQAERQRQALLEQRQLQLQQQERQRQLQFERQRQAERLEQQRLQQQQFQRQQFQRQQRVQPRPQPRPQPRHSRR